MDLYLVFLHFPQKLLLNDLSVHQGFPKLVLMDMDMVLVGLDVHRMDKLVCALLSCQIDPSTVEIQEHVHRYIWRGREEGGDS